jgi:DNA-binding NarL/FixJ family response regulator
MAQKKKSIYIVDDHPVILAALSGVIASVREWSLAGESNTVPKALKALKEIKPDLIITDYSIGGNDGFGFIRQLKGIHPEVPVLLFTVSDETRIGPRAFREGVNGMLMKGESIGTIKEAIKTLLAGRHWASSELTQLLMDQNRSASPEDVLSVRELQIFNLIGQGKTTKNIASELTRSVKTVENHREHIKSKLGVDSSLKLQTLARDYYMEMTQG